MNYAYSPDFILDAVVAFSHAGVKTFPNLYFDKVRSSVGNEFQNVIREVSQKDSNGL